MSKFNSIKEALQYQEACPLCSEKLSADSKSKDAYNNKFSFSLSSKTGDAFLVDKDTEHVSLVKDAMDGVRRKSLHVLGQFWTALHVECEFCQKYSYLVQLKFDISEVKIIDIELQLESITFEENDLITELRNSYLSNETWLITFSGNDTKTTKLPIIVFNLANPNETLNRAKKLAIFS